MKRFFPLFLAAAFLASSPADAGPARTGQWIWTRADLALYRDRSRADADLDAGVFIATIRWDKNQGDKNRAVLKRALSPALVPKLRAIVVRFDDSFHAAWQTSQPADDAEIAATTGGLLASLLDDVAAAGAAPGEIQLDYDCPERLLPRWAALLKKLADGPLKGREVWITSLTSQLRRENFGEMFRGAVAGHIPQVFDTGERFSPGAAASLRNHLDRAALPFRVGLGAFERAFENPRNATDHGRWQEALPLLKDSAFYRGLWIFPAGQPWLSPSRKGHL